MKYVKWIFVVLLISSLISFVEKDKPTGGLSVGDIAPDSILKLCQLSNRRKAFPKCGESMCYSVFGQVTMRSPGCGTQVLAMHFVQQP